VSETCRRVFEESLRAKQRFLEEDLDQVIRAGQLMARVLREGGKVLSFGNGGSAADAQHLACELVNRFLRDRPALPAVALTVDTSVLTSIANDSSYDDVFVRQVEALGRPGDLAVGISTSGTSPNVVAAMRTARDRGLHTLALSGRDGGPLAAEADQAIVVREKMTPRIQEIHLTAIHALCEVVEDALFPPAGPDR